MAIIFGKYSLRILSGFCEAIVGVNSLFALNLVDFFFLAQLFLFLFFFHQIIGDLI